MPPEVNKMPAEKSFGLKTIRCGEFFRNWAAVIAIGVLILFFSVRMPATFPSAGNIITILRAISITTVLAIGLTITLAAGGFDLSVGSAASLSSTLFMSLIVWFNLPVWVAIPYALAGALASALLISFLVVKCKIPDLLATCAMMFFLDGVALTYTGGGTISSGMPRPGGLPSIGKIPPILKTIGTSPTIIIIMLAAVFFVHVFLRYTKYGRFIYAVGGNRGAARFSGIPDKKYRVISFLLAGIFIGLAGILVACRNQSAQANAAAAYMMPALSAIFIGCSVAGQNKPNAFGTLIGATLVGLLDNGLIMMSVRYYSLNAIKGAVLAIALISAYASTKES